MNPFHALKGFEAKWSSLAGCQLSVNCLIFSVFMFDATCDAPTLCQICVISVLVFFFAQQFYTATDCSLSPTPRSNCCYACQAPNYNMAKNAALTITVTDLLLESLMPGTHRLRSTAKRRFAPDRAPCYSHQTCISRHLSQSNPAALHSTAWL